MRKLRTEDEIIANWKGDIDKPVVSICCITYNHESYIEDAIESFLIQETDFPFEILIHDDASTDRTADIIREYEAKYPRLIKPIYQTDNQYSKGLKMNPTFNFPRAKGEYIALCEGDDYWISTDKLNEQIELMRQYRNINISFHPAYTVNGPKLKKSDVLSEHYKNVKVVSPKQVILGGGGFMPTASIIFRRRALKNLPNWFYEEAPIGDYFIQVFMSHYGGALFFPKILSIYRVNACGSWTNSMINPSKQIDFKRKMLKSLSLLNSELTGKYQYEIKVMIYKSIRSALFMEIPHVNKRELLNYADLNLRQSIVLWFIITFPKISGYMRKRIKTSYM